MSRVGQVLRRVGAVATLVVGVALTAGCSADDGAPDKSPTCAAAQTAVDEAQRQAEIAIADLADDPDAARETLQGVRTALTAVESVVSDDQRDQLERAGTATRQLIVQARRSAKDAPIDGEAVTKARATLLDAVGAVRAAC
jgi:hypothetical protein